MCPGVYSRHRGRGAAVGVMGGGWQGGPCLGRGEARGASSGGREGRGLGGPGCVGKGVQWAGVHRSVAGALAVAAGASSAGRAHERGAVAHGCVGKGAPRIGAAGTCRSGVQDASGNVGSAWGHARCVYGHVLRRWGCSSGLLGVIDALGVSLWVCTRRGGAGTAGAHRGVRGCGGQWGWGRGSYRLPQVMASRGGGPGLL